MQINGAEEVRISRGDISNKEENISIVKPQRGCGYRDNKYRK